MAKTTIEYLRLEPAKNGFTLSYSERVHKEPTNGNIYDGCSSCKDIKEVYNMDGEDSDTQADKAFSRFRELAMRQYKDMKG